MRPLTARIFRDAPGRRSVASRLAGRLAALAIMVLATTAASAQTPPALPAGADVFSPPPIKVSPQAGAIVDGLRSAGPGEIITLAGDFLPGETKFELFGQTGADDAYRAAVDPIRVNAGTAALLLPKGLPAHATYLIRPSDRRGVGEAFSVNRTEAWWVGPRRVEAGRRFAIFGRNLTSGDRDRVFVYAVGADRKAARLPTVAANRFRVEVETADLSPGDYNLWIHNGAGGDLGWSEPLGLTVVAKRSSTAGRTFDVRDFGAAGDGVVDDGPAIERALAAAAAVAPATLYFPPGVYASRRAAVAPSGVRWLGAGAAASVIRFDVPLEKLQAPAFVYGFGERSDIAFEKLAIDGDRRIGDTGGALVSLEATGLRFSEVTLSSWGGTTLRLNANEVAIENSELTGAGSFLSSSSEVFVDRTTFRMTSDGESALASWGGRDIALTGNLLLNADPRRADGSGIGRLFVSQPHRGGTRNLYFAGNETRDSAPRDCKAVDCNKGEQIIFEFSGVALRSPPSKITRAGIVFPGLKAPTEPGGLDVVVVAGPGMGQRRRVVGAAAGALTLDRAWDVMPDAAKSRFYVTPVAERAVVFGNRFEGRSTHSEHDSNSTAVLLWGLCFDMVVADNDISRMRHGVMVAATSGSDADSVAAPFFVLVENNRISSGANGIYTGLTFGSDTDDAVTGGVGNVFRGNVIQSMSNIGVAIDTWDTRGGALSATVFERNRLSDVRYGIVSGLKLIWSQNAFKPTPPGGTRLLQTILHANAIKSRGAAFRTDAFQDWIDVEGVLASSSALSKDPAETNGR